MNFLKTQKGRTLAIVAAVVVALVVVSAVMLSAREGSGLASVLGVVSGSSDAQGSSGTQSADASSNPKALDPSKAGDAGDGTGSSTNGKSGGNSSTGNGAGNDSGNGSGDDPADPDSSKDPSDKEQTTKPSATGIKVLVKWWNDTSAKPAENVRIVLAGATSWSPDGAQKSAEKILGPVAYNKPMTLLVYPDGQSGKKISVPVAFTRSMAQGSESDAIHVEIKDATVRVLGTPVDNFDATYQRF